MTPLPIDLVPPPVFVPFHRLRGLARRFLRYALKVLGGALRPEYRATQEPPMLAIAESFSILETGFRATITRYIQWPEPLVCGLEPPSRGNLWNHIKSATAIARHQRRWWWQRAIDRWWA